jgi:hypothetical protein
VATNRITHSLKSYAHITAAHWQHPFSSMGRIKYTAHEHTRHGQLPDADDSADDSEEEQRLAAQRANSHHKLAAKLAHNDKRVRDRSVRLFRDWLARRKEVATADLLKLWKGLFYCYWMRYVLSLTGCCLNVAHGALGDTVSR